MVLYFKNYPQNLLLQGLITLHFQALIQDDNPQGHT